jgi:hypothetical protein
VGKNASGAACGYPLPVTVTHFVFVGVCGSPQQTACYMWVFAAARNAACSMLVESHNDTTTAAEEGTA